MRCSWFEVLIAKVNGPRRVKDKFTGWLVLEVHEVPDLRKFNFGAHKSTDFCSISGGE